MNKKIIHCNRHDFVVKTYIDFISKLSGRKPVIVSVAPRIVPGV